MTEVEALIKKKFKVKELSYKPCAIIIGRTGAGKTTLINGLCGTRHGAGEGRGSITRHLFRNDVSRGDYPFSMIDTPGTDSSTETYKHALLLREALTATEINTIFLVIKYDARFDKMIENYLDIEQPVYNYARKVVVIISHWDQSKDPQKSYQEICDLFEEECPSVTNLIFCSEQSSKEKVAKLMFRCISNMKKEKLEINDKDFFLKFNIYEMKSQMKVSFKEYQKETDLLVQEYTKLIKSVQSESVKDKDEILHMTIVNFKEEVDTLLQEFRDHHGAAMQELDYYTFYIKLEKENVRICDEFVEKVAPLMSYNLLDNKDPRNLIKQCPYCDLIWFKTEGCDGTTTCGNNEFEDPSNASRGTFWKYQITRIDGKLQWVKNRMKKHRSEESKENHKDKRSGSRRRITSNEPVGCGKTIRWGDLPKIDDELILELFKVKTIDQAKQLITDGHFEEARQNYESTIDRTFSS